MFLSKINSERKYELHSHAYHFIQRRQRLETPCAETMQSTIQSVRSKREGTPTSSLLDESSRPGSRPGSRPSSRGPTDVITTIETRKQTTEIVDNYIDGDFDDGTVDFVISNRERDRQKLQGLNDRLAAFMDRKHQLEFERLGLEGARQYWTQAVEEMKVMYKRRVDDVAQQLEENAIKRADLEAQFHQVQSALVVASRELDEAVRSRDASKEQIFKLLNDVSQAEAKLHFLQQHCRILEDDVTKLSADNTRLLGELEKTRHATAQIAQKSLEYEKYVQKLTMDIAKQQEEYQKEISEIRSKEMFATVAEYKSELSSALAEIRSAFEDQNRTKKVQLEQFYVKKVQQFKVEHTVSYQEEEYRLNSEIENVRAVIADIVAKNNFLRNEIESLQMIYDSNRFEYTTKIRHLEGELQHMVKEKATIERNLQDLAKVNGELRAQIEIYRQLLDGDGIGRKLVKVEEKEKEEFHIVKEEQVAHTKFERSNRGNVQFYDVSKDGKYIVLENTSAHNDENIGGYRLFRTIDIGKKMEFVFPENFTLQHLKKVKIWANTEEASHDPPESLIFTDETSWGLGQNVTTTLINREGEVMWKIRYNRSSSILVFA